MHKIVRVRRSAAAPANQASLVSLKEPAWISLVGKPANRTGFKVIRSEKEDKDIVIRRGQALLVMHLPTGTTAEQAESLLDEFGLRDDYRVVISGEGAYLLRKDIAVEDMNLVIGDEGVISIPVADQVNAYLDARAFTREAKRGDRNINGVKLSGIRFNSDWDEEKVRRWVEKNEIDFTDIKVEEGSVLVVRDAKACSDSKNTDSVEIDKGVTGLICRAEANDVPIRITRQVTTAAYGNYGYGHLNFVSALADPEFSSKIDHANFILWDVLDNIMFRSSLPLQERMVLIDAALEDYGTYVKAVVEALPASVLDAVSNDSANRNDEQETVMSNANSRTRRSAATDDKTAETKGAAAETKDEQNKTASGEEGPDVTRSDNNGEADDKQFVTREELNSVIDSTLTSVLKKAGLIKDEENAEGKDNAGKDSADATGNKETQTVLTADAIRGIVSEEVSKVRKEMETVIESSATAMESLKKRFDNVVSDREEPDEDADQPKKRSDNSPFKGAIFPLSNKAS